MMGAHVPRVPWRPFDTPQTRVEDMDMGEITRQELDAKMEAIKSWGDVRFAEQRAYVDARFTEVDTRFAEQRAYMDGRFAEVDARFAEQRAYMDVRFAEQDAKIDTGFARLDAKIDTRFAKLDAKFAKQLVSIVKWMVGTAIALFAVAITVVGIMLNVAVNAITAMPADDSGATTSPAHYAPARSLHRFERHHQARAGGSDARRDELHAGVAQVFHPE
ncbi:MAG: hypothetical protein ACXWC4_13675 [Telluria sp.]